MKDIIATGKFQNFDNTELINNIDPNVLEEIKKRDPSPLFKAFVVAHEGESNSHEVGVGKRVMKWFRNAVRKVYDVLKIGTPAFPGHNSDNSIEGRQVIGRVVGKFQNMAGNIEKVISIIQIFNPFKDDPYDCCSFEGEMRIPNNINNIVGDNDLGAITGIVLANTALGAIPAFPGAKLMAAVQMLENGGKKMELHEIKKGIQELNVTPLMLWSMEELKKFPQINDEFAKVESKLNNQGEAFTRITSERDSQVDKNKEHEKTISDLKLQLKNNESVSVFDSVVDERKIEDPIMKQYIVSRKSNFRLDSVKDDVKGKANKFIDDRIKDFENDKKIFNPEAKKKDEGGKGDTGEISEYLNQNPN